jgi:hypothetical protein
VSRYIVDLGHLHPVKEGFNLEEISANVGSMPHVYQVLRSEVGNTIDIAYSRSDCHKGDQDNEHNPIPEFYQVQWILEYLSRQLVRILQVRSELGQEILIEEIKALGCVLGTFPGGLQFLMTPVIPQRFELLSEVV